MKILKSNYFSIFFVISVLLHGTIFYFFNLKSNEEVNEKELIVNILKIPNQVTDIETIDLKKEVKPEVIKKYNKIKKNSNKKLFKKLKNQLLFQPQKVNEKKWLKRKN